MHDVLDIARVRQPEGLPRLPGLSATKIARCDPAVLTEFGHLVETFAVEEILKLVSWSEEVATAAYFRTQDGDEVDLVLETWDGRVAGFEVKRS